MKDYMKKATSLPPSVDLGSSPFASRAVNPNPRPAPTLPLPLPVPSATASSFDVSDASSVHGSEASRAVNPNPRPAPTLPLPLPVPSATASSFDVSDASFVHGSEAEASVAVITRPTRGDGPYGALFGHDLSKMEEIRAMDYRTLPEMLENLAEMIEVSYNSSHSLNLEIQMNLDWLQAQIEDLDEGESKEELWEALRTLFLAYLFGPDELTEAQGELNIGDKETYAAHAAVQSHHNYSVSGGHKTIVGPEISASAAPSEMMDNGLDFIMEPVGHKVRRPYILPRKLFSGLKAHQKESLGWFWKLHCGGTGGIVADDMGLGKTRQVLAYVAGLFNSDLIKKVLIVLPRELIAQWLKELRKVGLEQLTYLYAKSTKKRRFANLRQVVKDGGILITTYGFAWRCWDQLNVNWDYLILDEAHVIRNSGTKTYQGLQKISCAHSLLLTGTPAPNNLRELHTLFNFCCPELFGDMEFDKKFLAPLIDGNYKESSGSQLIASSEAAMDLQEMIRPYFLRRKKDEVLSLPEKNDIIVWLKLSPFQETLYTALLEGKIIDKRKEGDVFVGQRLLQKICNHPNKLVKGSKDEDGEVGKCLYDMVKRLKEIVPGYESENDYYLSCKIDIILKLLERFGGKHKVLIFSQTCDMLDTIQAAIANVGYGFARIDGSMSSREREKTISAFKEIGGATIFLISTHLGGTGLDLPVASRSIIVEPAWNPSTDDQSADRIYRIGQKNNVIIYRLIASETIEEQMFRKQLFKSGIFKSVTDDKDYKRYTTKDMTKECLRLPPNGFRTSRTQKLLEKESMEGNMSEELQREINFLQQQNIVGVTILSKIFSETIRLPSNIDESHTCKRDSRPLSEHSVRKGPDFIWSIPSASSYEDLDDRKARRSMQVKDLEDRIKSLTQAFKTYRGDLPDHGEKLKITIDEAKEALAKLKSDDDSKDET
ncbi:hypothetical protein ACP70R_010667 [Stipagrostis hirtigluma subsp. patula]